jgi:C4-dicarboxylate-specific signal transduction histidine kinase
MGQHKPAAQSSPPSGGVGLQVAGQMAAATMTGRFTHDLNNHLTTILGKAELALLSGDQERMKSALELGAEAARKSRDLVAQMQRFCAAQRTSEWTTASPVDAVRPTLTLLGRAFEKSGITLERRFGQVPAINCDLGALSLACYHLIRNAWEALESRGGWLQICLEQKGDDVEIRFADDGPGLPAELTGRVASEGFPSAAPEAGGLRIAAFAARAHGGRLAASNRPEGGALLVLRLPKQPPMAA